MDVDELNIKSVGQFKPESKNNIVLELENNIFADFLIIAYIGDIYIYIIYTNENNFIMYRIHFEQYILASKLSQHNLKLFVPNVFNLFLQFLTSLGFFRNKTYKSN